MQNFDSSLHLNFEGAIICIISLHFCTKSLLYNSKFCKVLQRSHGSLGGACEYVPDVYSVGRCWEHWLLLFVHPLFLCIDIRSSRFASVWYSFRPSVTSVLKRVQMITEQNLSMEFSEWPESLCKGRAADKHVDKNVSFGAYKIIYLTSWTCQV